MQHELACGRSPHRSVIRIEPDAPAAVLRALEARPPGGPVAIVADQAVVTFAGRIAHALQGVGIDARLCTMVADERAKSLATVQGLAAQLLGHGITRAGVVIAVGGGIVGDTAGFLAATYMRGVRCIQVPTTLLAMVDAAIGGKTAVNVELRDGSLAKNAIGSFAMPELVVCDPDALATLPPREVQCGLAECVKHALLADAGLAPWLRDHAMAVVGKDRSAISELVARAAAVKVAIVDQDPTEQGIRALLNLGHTYAHAIEARHDDRIKHGEAVALGLVAAMTVASRLGRVGHAQVEALQRLLQGVGLPTSIHELVPDPDPASTLRRCMELDKKRAGKGLVLVLPEGPVGAGLVEAPPEDAVMAGWSSIGAA
jgi:3-dehydroquinate synthase